MSRIKIENLSGEHQISLRDLSSEELAVQGGGCICLILLLLLLL